MKPLNSSNRKPLALAASLMAVIWFAMLAGRPLYDPDEGRYAEIPREILSGGDWLIPHLNGLVYLEKPPLQYWITALAFAALGQDVAVARLWTGLAGFLSMVIVFALGRRLWGFDAGLKAAMLLAGSILFVLLGHQLTLDMSLCFFLTTALACFMLAQLRRGSGGGGWMLGCWAAMALAVLTKGLIGVLIPAATLCIYVIWQGDFKALTGLHWRTGLPLFAAIAAPWFVLASRANGEFLRFFFIREHLQRFLTPIEQRSEPWWFFVPVLIVGILPWASQAIEALWRGWRWTGPRAEFAPERLLWIWSVFVLAFFSASDAKLIPYILPALPTLALACAAPGRAESSRHLLIGAALTASFGVGVLFYAAAIWSGANGRVLAVGLRPALYPLSAALLTAAAACWIFVARRRARAALAALCAGWVTAAIAITAGACLVQQLFSARDIAAVLARAAAPSAPIFSVQNYQQSLPFYLKRTVTLVDYRDEFALGLRQAPGLGIADVAEWSARWQNLGDAYAVMPLATRDRLAARGLPMRELAEFANRLCVVSRR